MTLPKVHYIQVPLEKQTLDDAIDWLTDLFGEPAFMSRSYDEVTGKKPVAHDPDRIYTTDYWWDAYVEVTSNRAFFCIKEHDDVALLFKLTFGGSNADS